MIGARGREAVRGAAGRDLLLVGGGGHAVARGGKGFVDGDVD